jgi:hypothetical protein
MISICLCPSCKKVSRKLNRISLKLDRIDEAISKNKENFSKLQLEQMLLAVTMFENEFYVLHRSAQVLNKDEYDFFLLRFDKLRQTLYDHIAYFGLF